MEHHVTKKRHLAKTISYRVVSTCVGFLIMWAITGSVKIGAAFGVLELLYKPLQYYIHERVWYRWIKYGLTDSNGKKKVEKNSKTTDLPADNEIFVFSSTESKGDEQRNVF